jgi:hypothetical protein
LAAYDYLAHFLKLESPYNSILFFAVLAVLFFIPAVLFVMGTDGMTVGWRELFARRFWLESLERFVRALCWLFGAGLAWAILAAFASLTG